MTTDLAEWGALAMLVGGMVVMGITVIGSAYTSALGGLAISAFGLMLFVGSKVAQEEHERDRRLG